MYQLVFGLLQGDGQEPEIWVDGVDGEGILAAVRVPEAEVEQLDTLLRAVTPEKQAWLGLGLGIGFFGLGSG